MALCHQKGGWTFISLCYSNDLITNMMRCAHVDTFWIHSLVNLGFLSEVI